jgi:hypothetical protein
MNPWAAGIVTQECDLHHDQGATMRDLLRSSINTGLAVAAAGTLAVTSAAPPAAPHSVPSLVGDVRLAAATTAIPPPGALITQFLTNQAQNCSLICPFIVQLAVEPAFRFAIIPVTFAAELQSGQPLLNAIARTDATVSGAANAALTGIIDNDLGLVLPRAQNALEVAVVGLIDIGTTAVTQPGNLLSAINAARTNFLGGLQQPPGTMPPPVVHNALEAGAVRVIEVVSSLTFQAPERLLLGVTQAADALFSTLGATGNIGSALAATGASVATTVSESAAFVRHALTEPIPISPAVTAAAAVSTTATATASKSSTTPVKPSVTKRAPAAVTAPLHRIAKADNDTPSEHSSETATSKPAAKHDDGDGGRHGARHSASKHDAQSSASDGQGNRKHSD